MKSYPVLLSMLLISIGGFAQQTVNLSLILEKKGQLPETVCSFNTTTKLPLHIEKKVKGLIVSVTISRKESQLRFSASAKANQLDSCYFSLKMTYVKGQVYSYLGEEKSSQILRQSPHNPAIHSFGDLAKQDLPMIAIKGESGFFVALSNTPGFYDNYTTQEFNPEQKLALLSSGDNGKIIGKAPKYVQIRPYYHHLNKNEPHTFNGIIFKSGASNLNNLRRDVLFAITERWGNHIKDRFGATSFASNYMLLRKNETGNSKYWIVPGILYSNKQYSRDAFWQSMVLPKEFDLECYKNEVVAQSRGAERPLFALIWAYRTLLNKRQPDIEAAKKSLTYIEEHIRDGKFYSSDDPAKKDFQSWYDAVAFDPDEVITYNQGLLCVALLSAERLNLKPKTSSAMAIFQYQALFNKKGGYFPVSEKKDLPAVDALVGDVLAQVFFGKVLLTTESINQHFNTIRKYAKTAYGYKVTSMPNGDFPSPNAFHATNYPVDPSLGRGAGNYQYGGSWFLYDMLFLMDSYLHKVPGAMDELLWRVSLDFKLGGTYFEYINTVSGSPEKANQGWNAAVYAIWNKLIENGKADRTLYNAIDQLK